jgi:hypothetical protein
VISITKKKKKTLKIRGEELTSERRRFLMRSLATSGGSTTCLYDFKKNLAIQTELDNNNYQSINKKKKKKYLYSKVSSKYFSEYWI